MPNWRSLVTEPARPAAIRERPGAHWYAVATVCIGAFMGQLDASIVTLAFPALEQEFDTSVSAVTWVGLTYLLVLVALVAPMGRLSDMVGRKLLYIYGFGVFIIGSALCGMAPDLLWLNVYRAVQAIGAAMLQANSVAIIFAAMPRDKLGRGIGVQGAAQAMGLALGPAVGGLLVSLGGWRLIFWVNVPMGLVGMALGWFFIPRTAERAARTRFDLVGLALFFPAVVAFMAALSLGNDLGWTSIVLIVLAAVALLAGALFVARQWRTSSPLIPLGLFRRLAFSAGIGSGLLSYLVMFGALFVMPFYLQRALGLGADAAGLLLTIMPVVLGLIAPVAGRWADRFGPRPLTVVGMTVSGVSLAFLALWADRIPLAAVAAALVILGAGMGMFTPPNNAAIMAAAPAGQAGVAAGVLNMTRGMGTALGLAVTGLVFTAVAGANASGAEPVTAGFTAAAWLLAGVALVAAVLAALRGRTSLAG